MTWPRPQSIYVDPLGPPIGWHWPQPDGTATATPDGKPVSVAQARTVLRAETAGGERHGRR